MDLGFLKDLWADVSKFMTGKVFDFLPIWSLFAAGGLLLILTIVLLCVKFAKPKAKSTKKLPKVKKNNQKNGVDVTPSSFESKKHKKNKDFIIDPLQKQQNDIDKMFEKIDQDNIIARGKEAEFKIAQAQQAADKPVPQPIMQQPLTVEKSSSPEPKNEIFDFSGDKSFVDTSKVEHSDAIDEDGTFIYTSTAPKEAIAEEEVKVVVAPLIAPEVPEDDSLFAQVNNKKASLMPKNITKVVDISVDNEDDIEVLFAQLGATTAPAATQPVQNEVPLNAAQDIKRPQETRIKSVPKIKTPLSITVDAMSKLKSDTATDDSFLAIDKVDTVSSEKGVQLVLMAKKKKLFTSAVLKTKASESIIKSFKKDFSSGSFVIEKVTRGFILKLLDANCDTLGNSNIYTERVDCEKVVLSLKAFAKSKETFFIE